MKSLVRKIDLSDSIDSVVDIDSEGEVPAVDLGLDSERVQRIWQTLLEIFATGFYPGISFCLRYQGKILLNRALGYRQGGGPDDEMTTEKLPMKVTTPVCLFSASKVATAMVIHGLAEQGEIHLMDPVSHYLPKFGLTGKNNLTIYHVLTHRSGIPLFPEHLKKLEVLLESKVMSKRLHHLEPKWTSGRAYGYHALTGGFVLAEIATKVTGQDMPTLLENMIRKPLGMKYFTFGLAEEHVNEAAENYFTGWPMTFPFDRYLQRLLGASVEDVVELSNDPGFRKAVIPAGNIYATAEETSRFFQMLLNGGEYDGNRLFHELTVRHALQESGKPEFDRMFMVPMRYSAGMMLGDNPIGLWGHNSEHAFGHLGFTNKMCWADQARSISVALLTTGNPVLGPHLPLIVKLVTQIGRYCK